MKFVVREEEYTHVQQDVIDILSTTRRTPTTRQRCDWLYQANPDGEAVIWTVRNGDTGEIAGFTAALPRRVMVDGTVRRCWNCADFSIRQNFRTLGAAVKLRRAAKEAVDAGRVDFLYAHPNSRMQMIHTQVGHSRVGNTIRTARVLSSGPYIERRLPTKMLPRVASRVIDRVLQKSIRRYESRTSEIRFEPEVCFDERFDRLFDQGCKRPRVIGVRDARYLNWRFRDNPVYQSHAVLAERAGCLVGYGIFTIDHDNVARLKDLFAVDDVQVVQDLFSGLIRQCDSLKATSISMVLLKWGYLHLIAEKFGFYRRHDVTELFCHVSPDNRLRHALFDAYNWYLTPADRDV